jgi:ABC-type multidrug transport system fused ATPase/permease subunit
LINVQVPFLLKYVVDQLTITSDVAASIAQHDASIALPLMLVLGYGVARSAAYGMSELKNAIFASVSHGAIRHVSRDVFTHLINMDMQFHLDRNTGMLSRVIDRGTRSINFVLSAMLFNVVPVVLEVGLVSGVLVYKLGPWYAFVTLSTIASYTVFTVIVSDWRTGIRKAMNQAESAASGTLLFHSCIRLEATLINEITRSRHRFVNEL